MDLRCIYDAFTMHFFWWEGGRRRRAKTGGSREKPSKKHKRSPRLRAKFRSPDYDFVEGGHGFEGLGDGKLCQECLAS